MGLVDIVYHIYNAGSTHNDFYQSLNPFQIPNKTRTVLQNDITIKINELPPKKPKDKPEYRQTRNVR